MPRILDIETGISGSDRYGSLFSLENKQREYVYLVEGDSANQSVDTILATPGLPGRGAQLETNVFVVRRTPQQDKRNPTLWRVTVEADNRADGGIDPQPNPWDRIPEWEWSDNLVEEVVEFDQQDPDVPIENSVKEPLVATTLRPISVLRITRFEISFSPVVQQTYLGAVNLTPFWGAPANVALMRGIRDKAARIEGFYLREVVYEIWFNFRVDHEGTTIGWKLHTLNKATKYLDAPDADIDDAVPFLDAQGHRTTGLIGDDGLKFTSRSGGQYLTFNVHRAAEFNNLSLGPW